MRRLFTFIILAISFPLLGSAQGDDCSDPKVVALKCLGTGYPGETTAGYTNNFNASGNDIVYRIDVPANAQKLLVSITRLSAPLILIWKDINCSSLSGTIMNVNGPVENYAYTVSGGSSYYLVIDHANATDINYDISFGYETNFTSIVNVPDTRGLFNKSSIPCVSPYTQPDVDVTYNGIHKSLPITFSPLNASGVLCARYFYENRTGQKGVKLIEFTFGSSYINVTPVVTTMAGFYNSGTWNVLKSGNKYIWYFIDQAGLGYGDGPGSSGTCFGYEFCFNVTPLNNDPVNTKVTATAYPDNRGVGYSGSVFVRCCAAGNCTPGGGTSASSGVTSIINDPPVLPVTFVSFEGAIQKGTTTLRWTTSAEKNTKHFEIERSVNGIDFDVIGTVQATGNSNVLTYYTFSDHSTPAKGAYYRIRSVDFDGHTDRNEMIFVSNINSSINVFPNPTKGELTVESPERILNIAVKDTKGEEYVTQQGNGNFLQKISLSQLPQGLYYIIIQTESNSFTARFIKE